MSPPLPAALLDQYAPMSSIKMQLRLLAHRVSGLQAKLMAKIMQKRERSVKVSRNGQAH